MFDFIKTIAKLDFKGMQELWQNDTKRANFYLFCWDMFWAQIMMWIIAAMFMGEGYEESGPLAHGLTNAVYNSFSDMPIQNIIKSMGGDLNPPSYSIFKNL